MEYGIFTTKGYLIDSERELGRPRPEARTSIISDLWGRIVPEALDPTSIVLVVLCLVLVIENFLSLPQSVTPLITTFAVGTTLILLLPHLMHLRVVRQSEQVARPDKDRPGESVPEKERLYEQLVQFIDDLEDEVEERTSDLQVAYIELARLKQAKSDFIRVASHELRTPLTVVHGYIDMLLQDPGVKENTNQLALLTGIYSGAIRLNEIVTNLIDMAKIDSQAMDLYPQSLSLTTLMQRVYRQFERSLVERNLTLTLESLGKLPLLEADPDALGKVFSHLLGNAIKYTPDGGTITVSGRHLLPGPPGDTAGTASPLEEGIEIIISDTGIGIDRPFHQLIFTKFYQAGDLDLHSSGQTKFKGGGPGLGLAIVRGIVEAHSGKVRVESPGYDEDTLPGSRFHVVLPLHQKRKR